MSSLHYATFVTVSIAAGAAVSATTLSALDILYQKSTDKVQEIARMNLQQTIQGAIIEHAVDSGMLLDMSKYSTVVQLVKMGKLSEKTLEVVEQDGNGNWKVKQLSQDIDLSEIPTN